MTCASGIYGHGAAGSSRVLLEQPPGRCKPMCHPCEMHYDYAQRYSVSSSYPWRTSSLLNLHLHYSICFRFLLVVGCVGITGTGEGKVIVGREFQSIKGFSISLFLYCVPFLLKEMFLCLAKSA